MVSPCLLIPDISARLADDDGGLTRAVLHDPALYPSPDEVIPERYLNRSDQFLNPDPQDFAFGYGRRCANQCLYVVLHWLLKSYCHVQSVSRENARRRHILHRCDICVSLI